MDTTPNLNLPYLAAAQSQKHVTHNEALRALDALVQLGVSSRTLTSPPASPVEGQRYIVATPATGAWTGQGGKLAAYQDGTWMFYIPLPGWLAWVTAESALVAWNGNAWVAAQPGINPTPLVGINATADATNRLAVKSPASLFDNSGNGHQLKINKAAATDTASLLIQNAYSGRVELGLTGDDNFHCRVSADGTTWTDAIVVDRTSGAVAHAAGARATFQHAASASGLQLKPAPSDPTNPTDGDLWYNATTATFRMRQNGITSGLGGGSQAQSDWNATVGVTAIANKPTLGTSASHAASDFDAAGAAAAAQSAATAVANSAQTTAATAQTTAAAAQTTATTAQSTAAAAQTTATAAQTTANAKQSPATTLAGYGITDAISKTTAVSANLVLAGPTSGAGAAPSFRVLTAADLPAGGASGVPGGTAGQLQVNSAGAFGGTSGLTWNATSGTLTLNGSLVLSNGATGLQNVGFGLGALANAASTSAGNVGIGPNAGAALTTGGYNVMTGLSAGTALTTGSGNILIGQLSGAALTTQNSNVAIGDHAFASANGTLVLDNVAIGRDALRYMTNAQDNTAVGAAAGGAVTTGAYNSLFGCLAGKSITTGSNNLAFGYQALPSCTTGANNLAVGNNLAALTSANNVTAVGGGAGNAVTTGDQSTFIGNGAGPNATTGLAGTFIGYGSGRGVTTGNGNTFIGGNYSNLTAGVVGGSWNVVLGAATGLPSGLGNSFAVFDGLGNIKQFVDSNGNVAFNSQGSFGGANRAVFVPNGVAPTANPVGGGLIYVEAGALKFRGSGGTITVLGAA